MRNITNNLLGGFFRTFGRVLFYILLGLILTFIIQKTGLKLPFSIGTLRVNASELKNWSLSQTRLTYDDHGTSSFSDWYSTPHTFDNMSLPVKRVGFRLRSSDGLSYNNTYNFTFGYLPSPDALSYSRMEWTKNGDSNLQENFTCNNWYVNSNNYYLTDCSFTPSSNYDTSDYLFITIFFNGNGTYLNSIRPYMFGYDERLGTNAVITNSANSIIHNNDTNTQNIINNQNQNTQATIDAINNSNKVCEYIDKKNITTDNSYMFSNGSISSNNSFGITDYISINSDSELIVVANRSGSASLCFYNINKTLISCIQNSTMTLNQQLTIPITTSYFRASIDKGENKPQFKICKNGNQGIIDSLTDSSSPDVSSLNDMAGWLPPGPLDSILNLPLTLLNSLNTALSGTCQPITLTLPYINENLTLPCISSIYQQIGAITFVNWVGTIASAFILFKYLMKLYKWVDDTLTFRENNWLDNWGGVD